MILHSTTRIVVHGNEKAELERISMALNHICVIAGLVPAIAPSLPSPAQRGRVGRGRKNNRGGRDKPGNDRVEAPSAST
jgi:hypothetical protein